MKHLFIILLIFNTIGFGNNLTAQINDSEKYISIVQGSVYTDTIFSRFQPSALTDNCYMDDAISLGQQKYKITIKPPLLNPNYLGTASLTLQYTDGFPPKPRYIKYHIQFVKSKISTRPDFVTVTDNAPVVILPLTNDFTTSSDLRISGISQVQGGNAVLHQDSVIFNMDEETNISFLLYSVADSLNATASGMIYLLKQEEEIAVSDTFHYTLLNTRPKYLFMPKNGFVISVLPTKGNIIQEHEMVFKYLPSKGKTGDDVISFTDLLGNSRVVYIKLINEQKNTSSVRDDRFYTAKNTPITFDVFDNDLSRNFPISGYSNGLVYDTLGLFTYTPPTGFSGIKNFTYTVNYGTFQSTGKIVISVGNFSPDQNINYNFNTTKNNPVIINYNIPIQNYAFNLLNAPQFGSVEIFNTNTTLTEGCNEFESKVTIIYTPDNNYYGNDSFDLEYCVDNNPCKVYKTYIQINNVLSDTICPCKGPDCVWAGDLNHNGKVSVADLIALGRFIGLNGSPRNDILYPFRSGQHANDWAYKLPNGYNIKHIDANGDGLLSAQDTMAISDYYGDVSNFIPEEILAIKEYPFEIIPNTTELDSGDLLILDVVIGSNSKPVVDIFGLAFELNFSPSLIDSASLTGHFYKDSWFAADCPTLQMVKQPKEGLIHAGFTRTAGIVEDEIEGIKPIGVSGNGYIGQIMFIVEDEIEGIKTDDNFITRRIKVNNIELEDATGERYFLNDTYVDVRININKNTPPVPSEDKLLVFPNPGGDIVNLFFNGRNIIHGYRIFNNFGLLMNTGPEVNTQSVSLNTSSLPDGIYIIQVVTTEGVISKKIEILHK